MNAMMSMPFTSQKDMRSEWQWHHSIHYSKSAYTRS